MQLQHAVKDKLDPAEGLGAVRKVRVIAAGAPHAVFRLNGNRREWQGDQFRQIVGFGFAGAGGSAATDSAGGLGVSPVLATGGCSVAGLGRR